MTEDRCELCRFWRAVGDATPRGHCHRNPPTSGSGSPWPFVIAMDWCGEFQPHDQEERAA